MDDRDWTDRPLEPGEVLEVAGTRITRRLPGAARLVSGDLYAALSALSPGAPIVGLAGEIGDGDACLRIARDRALLLAWASRDWPGGWLEDGAAVSLADDLYAVLEIEGAGGEDLIVQIGGYVPGQVSRSCAIRLAGGETALLVRRADAWLLLIETSALTAVTTWLRGCVALSDPDA